MDPFKDSLTQLTAEQRDKGFADVNTLWSILAKELKAGKGIFAQ